MLESAACRSLRIWLHLVDSNSGARSPFEDGIEV